LSSYRKERMEKVEEVTRLTDLHTDLIFNNQIDTDMASKFSPAYSNRVYFRQVFPKIFSGFATKYTEDVKCTSLQPRVMEHVPYVQFQKNPYSTKDSYDVFKSNKFCLICNKTSTLRYLAKIFRHYQSSLMLVVAEMRNLQPGIYSFFDKGNIMLIRPDSFVVHIGKWNDYINILSYLDNTICFKSIEEVVNGQ